MRTVEKNLQNTAKDIKKSRANAYIRLLKLLEEKRTSDEDFRSGETIITYCGNKRGVGVGYSLQKSDSDYFTISGVPVYLFYSGLFIQGQPKNFANVEQSLIILALDLAPSKKDKLEIVENFVKPYNNRVKATKNAAK